VLQHEYIKMRNDLQCFLAESTLKLTRSENRGRCSFVSISDHFY